MVRIPPITGDVASVFSGNNDNIRYKRYKIIFLLKLFSKGK
jgi:hypothetical protein